MCGTGFALAISTEWMLVLKVRERCGELGCKPCVELHSQGAILEELPIVMPETTRDPRVYFAAERTFLAWIRTGLALMGFGFVVARFGLFLRELGSTATHLPMRSSGFSLWTGTALVMIGVVINLVSTAQHVRTIRALNEGGEVVGHPSTLGMALAFLLVVIGLTISVYLMIVRP